MTSTFDPVASLPHPAGTVLHESSRMLTSTNTNAEGRAFTTLSTMHLQLAVHEGELRVRFTSYQARRAVRPRSERPRRARQL